MKTAFDKTTRDELIRRINALNAESTAQWGRMTVYQMLRHCRLWEEMVLGKRTYKRVFIGRIFGRMALRSMLKDDSPLKRNMPSIPGLIITGHGNIDEEKAAWINLLQEHGHFFYPDFIHPFLGKMTKEQIGRFIYKHADHHLRQFNS